MSKKLEKYNHLNILLHIFKMIKTLCENIKLFFEKKNSTFGNELYNTVKSVTSNFSKNLSFFYLKDKIDNSFLDYMVFQYCIHNKNTFVITVWPVTYDAEDIFLNNYNKYGSIIYKKEIRLQGNGFKNMLHFISDKKNHPRGMDLWFAEPHRHKNPLTIYIFEAKEMVNISTNQKINYLTNIFNNNRNHVLQIHAKGGLNNLYVTTRAKRECRNEIIKQQKIAPISFAPDKQYSHHVNDEHYETIELCRIFLNDNTLNLIQLFKFNELEKFEIKFNSFLHFLIKYNICLNDILIYNSGVLAPFGLREPGDIDFVQGGNKLIPQRYLPKDIDIQNKYFRRGYMVLATNHKSQYMEDNQNFMIRENINSKKFIWKLSLDDIIYNPKYYFYYRNIKFMTPKLFEKVKKIRNRPKDIAQLPFLKYIVT